MRKGSIIVVILIVEILILFGVVTIGTYLKKSSSNANKEETDGIMQNNITSEDKKSSSTSNNSTEKRLIQNDQFGYTFEIPVNWTQNGLDSYQDPDQLISLLEVNVKNITEDGVKEDIESLERLSPHEQIDLDGVTFTKIRNLDLDGCEAVYSSTFYKHNKEGQDYGFSTICAGNSKLVNIALIGEDKAGVDQLRDEYEEVVSSFRFNTLRL